MSDTTDEAEGQWAEELAEMATLFDGTAGLFGVSWAELAVMDRSSVIVTALEETPLQQRGGFRGQMISSGDAADVIARAKGIMRTRAAERATTQPKSRSIDPSGAEPAPELLDAREPGVGAKQWPRVVDRGDAPALGVLPTNTPVEDRLRYVRMLLGALPGKSEGEPWVDDVISLAHMVASDAGEAAIKRATAALCGSAPTSYILSIGVSAQ